MSSLNLTKGERCDLTKTNPGLKIANIGLGWDVNSGNGGSFDLDAFAIVLGSNKKVLDDKSVVYFRNLKAHGVEHAGDSLTGQGDGDDETIKVDFSKLPATAEEVLVCVNIYMADSKRQNFGMVNNAFIRVYDGETKAEILKFDLTEDYSAFNGMLMGKLYKKDGEWKFQSTGEGKNGDINAIAAAYFN